MLTFLNKSVCCSENGVFDGDGIVALHCREVKSVHAVCSVCRCQQKSYFFIDLETLIVVYQLIRQTLNG